MQEQTPLNTEAVQASESLHLQLREERWRNAENRSHNLLAYQLRNLDRIASPNVSIIDEHIDFVLYDSTLSPAEGIALAGNGVDPKVFVQQRSLTPNNKFLAGNVLADKTEQLEAETVIQHGDASLVIASTPYWSGITYHIRANDDEAKEALRQTVRQNTEAAFQTRPAYAAIHDAIQCRDPTSQNVTFYLNLSSDPAGTMAVLDDLGVFRSGAQSAYAEILQGKTTERAEILSNLERLATKIGISSDDYIRISSGKGVRQTIFFDKHTDDISISLQETPEDLYVETPNQWQGASEAFIDTSFAKELFEALLEHGLTVSETLKDILTKEDQAERFGSVYTQITREIAKWVNRPGRMRISNLFTVQGETPDELDEEVSNDCEIELRQKIQVIETTGFSEPIRVLVDLMQQTIQRKEYASAVPVTVDDVRIDKYACFDVTGYYLAAATNDGLNEIHVGDTPILEKTFGGNTFMTTGPTLFNGVTLPKGALLSRSDSDKGWYFQRLTPFTFDNQADMTVFGSELVKAKDVEGQAIARLGGISLRHLINR